MDQQKRSFLDVIEENIMALVLGIMTLLTFANVVTRKGFNFNILWALEVTVFLFAWLVLLGTVYGAKKNSHLGVDALTSIMPHKVKRTMGVLAGLACIVYAFLMLKGAWDYWANFANLPQTTGRWFPTGFQEKFLAKGWYETKDIPVPGFLRFLEDWFNEGYEYEKIPRLLPYFVLPLSMALLLFRFTVQTIRLYRGDIDQLIASHEVEDQIDEAAKKIGD